MSFDVVSRADSEHVVAFEFGLYAYGRSQCGMKNFNRINPFMPFVQNYGHFTGLLASGMVYTKELNVGISSGDLTHR